MDAVNDNLHDLTRLVETLSRKDAQVPVGRSEPAPVEEWILPVDFNPQRLPANSKTTGDPFGARPLTVAAAQFDGTDSTHDGFLLDRFNGLAGPVTYTGTDPEALFELPIVTIAENSSLMGATALTGIFGRVPTRGVVVDPIPFKILTGADNLAAQGWEIPYLEEAVWRGEARGDRTLRCVTGELLSVTFVFEDGTIRTVRGARGEALGTLSDIHGYPCIPGTFVSDFPKQIAALAAAGAASGAAEAFAQSETTTVVTGTGSVVSAVTGDADRYVVGRAGSEAFLEIARAIKDRFPRQLRRGGRAAGCDGGTAHRPADSRRLRTRSRGEADRVRGRGRQLCQRVDGSSECPSPLPSPPAARCNRRARKSSGPMRPPWIRCTGMRHGAD